MSSLNESRPRFRQRRQLRDAGSLAARNRIWAHRLGWLPQRSDVAREIGLRGAPSPDAFAAALRQWQRSQGLPATGVLGPSTWRRMQGEVALETGGTKAAPCTFPGNKEFNEWLQRGLNKVMKLKLATDGVVGKQTAAAIGDFQKRQGLTQTFIADNATILALIAAGAGDPPIPGRKSVQTVQAEHPDFKKYKPVYYRWVQDSLNRVMGLSMKVDGAMGTQSKAALRDFQKKVGIKASGAMDCKTETRLIQKNGCRKPHPEVKVQLPLAGVGFYSYKGNLRYKQFAIAETIAALVNVGMRWVATHPTGPRIGIGEISLQGGGCIAGHASHQLGVDVDIALPRNDGREEHTVVGAAAYSRADTQQLVDLLRANGVLKVKRIFLNDPKVSGRENQPNHDNHLHVRFELPARFA
jgi:peptidoglycan hydrolase-like protein with peptidoglycan-binding domain